MSWSSTLLSNAKARAKKHGREFSLTSTDITDLFNEQGGLCYWLKVPLAVVEQRLTLTLPTLDRVDSDRGYTRDNVVLASLAANRAKSNSDPDEWEEFLSVLRFSLTDRLPSHEN